MVVASFSIIALEELKKIQKKLSETGQEESFTGIVLLIEGETEETIGYKKYRFGPGSMYFISENQLLCYRKMGMKMLKESYVCSMQIIFYYV